MTSEIKHNSFDSSDKTDKTDIIVIAGPTATGKTAVAVSVAEKLNAEIVSVDSRQIYKGMEIGSGAPSKDELARVRHHLVGTVPPAIRISAGEYARMADKAITDIRSRDKLPIIVGGSGLYIRALIDGLSPIPASDPDARAGIQQEVTGRGMAEMISELTAVDPEYAKTVGVNDRKRLIRALEVWRSTGKSFTDWHLETKTKEKYKPLMYGLSRPRTELHEFIARRVKSMVSMGWVREVERLAELSGGFENLPPSVTEGLGYRNIVAYLNGEHSLDETLELITIATRQFAKRQMTWFRGDQRIIWNEASGEQASYQWVKWIISNSGRMNQSRLN